MHHSLDSTYANLQEILHQRIGEIRLRGAMTDVNGDFNSIREIFFRIKYDTRLYLLSAEPLIRDMWEYIREDENKLDFIMGVKVDLLSRLGAEEVSNVAARVANAVAGDNNHNDDIDSDTYERLPAAEWLSGMLKNNTWLLILFLIDQLPLPEELIDVR